MLTIEAFLSDLVAGVCIWEIEFSVQKALLFLVIILKKMSRLMGTYPFCPLKISVLREFLLSLGVKSVFCV